MSGNAKIYIIVSIITAIGYFTLMLFTPVFPSSFIGFLIPSVLLINGVIAVPLASRKSLKDRSKKLAVFSTFSISMFLSAMFFLHLYFFLGWGNAVGWFMIGNWFIKMILILSLLVVLTLMVIAVELYVRLKNKKEKRTELLLDLLFRLVIPLLSMVLIVFSFLLFVSMIQGTLY